LTIFGHTTILNDTCMLQIWLPLERWSV